VLGWVRELRDPQPGHPGLPRPRYDLTAAGTRQLEVTEAAYVAVAGHR
jgi:hypothetical protein